MYTKSKKWPNVLVYKKHDNVRYVFIYKKLGTLSYAIFMKILKCGFIYKKHETLRYVTFLYRKTSTLRKKQDNLRYAFMYKNPDTLRYAIFHWIFEIGGGGGTFLYLKKTHFALHFYIQKTMHFALRFYYKKSDTLRYIFICK